MATFTVNFLDTIHTLPQYCLGANGDIFFYDDPDNQYYRSLYVKLGLETVRASTWAPSATHQFWPHHRDFAKHLQDNLGTANFAAWMSGGAKPNPQPTTSITSPVAPNGSGWGPNDYATNLYQQWVQAGIKVIGREPYNEPRNMFNNHGDAGSPWFDPASFGGGSAGINAAAVRADDWATIRHRDYYTPFKLKVSQLGQSTRVWGCSVGNMSWDGYQSARDWVTGAMRSGAGSNPNSPAVNVGFCDGVAVHPYTGTHVWYGFPYSNQSALNELYYEQSLSAFASSSKSSLWATSHLRSLLDGVGGSATPIAWTECGLLGSSANPSPHADVGYAIMFARWAGPWKLQAYHYHSIARGSASSEHFILATSAGGFQTNFTSEAAWQPGRRYYTCRDLIRPYMHDYKRQARVTITSASGNTPGATALNPVPRIQVVAGLHTDRLDLAAVLLQNVDLTGTEGVTLNLAQPATGQITGKKMAANQGHSGLASITPFGVPGTASITFGADGAPSLSAGEAYLLLIPIAATGEPPPPPPPPPTVATKISNLSDDFDDNSLDSAKWQAVIG